MLERIDCHHFINSVKILYSFKLITPYDAGNKNNNFSKTVRTKQNKWFEIESPVKLIEWSVIQKFIHSEMGILKMNPNHFEKTKRDHCQNSIFISYSILNYWILWMTWPKSIFYSGSVDLWHRSLSNYITSDYIFFPYLLETKHKAQQDHNAINIRFSGNKEEKSLENIDIFNRISSTYFFEKLMVALQFAQTNGVWLSTLPTHFTW